MGVAHSESPPTLNKHQMTCKMKQINIFYDSMTILTNTLCLCCTIHDVGQNMDAPPKLFGQQTKDIIIIIKLSTSGNHKIHQIRFLWKTVQLHKTSLYGLLQCTSFIRKLTEQSWRYSMSEHVN